MTLIGPILLLAGLVLCWVIGRFATRWQSGLTSFTSAVFGVLGLMRGFGDFWESNFLWALVILAIYGTIGSLISRGAQAKRGVSND